MVEVVRVLGWQWPPNLVRCFLLGLYFSYTTQKVVACLCARKNTRMSFSIAGGCCGSLWPHFRCRVVYFQHTLSDPKSWSSGKVPGFNKEGSWLNLLQRFYTLKTGELNSQDCETQDREASIHCSSKVLASQYMKQHIRTQHTQHSNS